MPRRCAVRFAGSVFIGDEILLEVGFDAALAGLAKLARDDALTSASEDAYGEGVKDLIRVGQLGSVPDTSKQIEVRFRSLATRDDCAGLAVRWEATGPGGGLFPALDADITVMPVGEQATLLRVAGSYRPMPGARHSARRGARRGDLAPGCRGHDADIVEPHRGCHRPSSSQRGLIRDSAGPLIGANRQRDRTRKISCCCR